MGVYLSEKLKEGQLRGLTQALTRLQEFHDMLVK